ncbi:MAG: molybdopterin-binding protein [Gammaproteobacteria bacterium]|jgi:molybdopterin-biosynthesis enzyme MoeA-like protein
MSQSTAGIVIVGDELLLGRCRDRHLQHVIDTLRPRAMQLAWCRYVGDDRTRLGEELRQTQQDEIPVFCFGGIGATPDDQTRQAAADAFGCPLVRHPEAAAHIEAQFGADAHPHRIRMADLPEDALLIPNPVNRIPGFTLYEHHFLPGFPQMAWPMLDWVLERYYPAYGEVRVELGLQVFGVRESELLEMMESLAQRHADARLFSLPHLGETLRIELGFRGRRSAVQPAFDDLVAELERRALSFEPASAA